MPKPTPSTHSLLEYAEAARLEARNDLVQAVRICARRNDRLNLTDLHVRELLTYVDHASKRENGKDIGIDLSYDQIGRILLCERRTARTVVDRAVREFGLLIVDRHKLNDSNNYRIDREAVRLAITVREEVRPLPDPDSGGAAQCQGVPLNGRGCRSVAGGGATQRHPTTLLSPKAIIQKETTTTASNATEAEDEWRVVVVSLEKIVSRVDLAIDGAKRIGYGPQRCLELIEQFCRLPTESQNPGKLFNWLTKARSAPTDTPKPSKRKPKPFDFEAAKQKYWFRLRTERVKRGPLLPGEQEAMAQEAERLARIEQAKQEQGILEEVKE